MADNLSDKVGGVTKGDLRQIVSETMMRKHKGEVSNDDVIAMSKALDSISNSINTEIKVMKAVGDMRKNGQNVFGVSEQLGATPIGNTAK